jgi:sec-independent protein translocase protein TatA
MVGDILQPTHLIFILVVALLVLGPKRLPEVGRALGDGLRDFRSAISGESNDRQQETGVLTHDEPDAAEKHEFAHEEPEPAPKLEFTSDQSEAKHEFAHTASEPAEAKHEFAHTASEPADKPAEPPA